MWTLAPFSNHGSLPPAITFQYQNDTVYFSATLVSQLLPNGSGFGTFDSDMMYSSESPVRLQQVTADAQAADLEPGGILRWV